MTRLCLATLTLAGLMLSACGREEPPNPPMVPPQPQAEAEPDPALKSSYAQDIEKKLAQIEKGIDDLAAGAKTAAAATTQKLDAAIVQMHELSAKTKAKAAELKTATGEKWDHAKAESDRLMAKLHSAYEAAKNELAHDASPTP